MASASITVVIPVYRGESTIEASVMSVIEQNVNDLEILIFDDGSPDRSAVILEELLAKLNDSRVTLYRQKNCGLAGTLNRGISLAVGSYIARQDQDDIVLPGRLEFQRAFLEENPDVAIVGTWAQIHVGNSPSERYHLHAAADDALRLELLFDNPFVHSSVMFRTEVVRSLGGYSIDKSREPPEDYELWSRIARHHRIANIPEVLTIYREVSGSMSRTGESPFLSNVMRISAENIFHRLSTRYSMDDCTALTELYHRGGTVGYRSALTKAKARTMLHLAAESIAGERHNWSPEFEAVYRRMCAHLDSRFLRRLIPNRLLIPVRWVRDKLRQMRRRT